MKKLEYMAPSLSAIYVTPAQVISEEAKRARGIEIKGKVIWELFKRIIIYKLFKKVLPRWQDMGTFFNM